MIPESKHLIGTYSQFHDALRLAFAEIVAQDAREVWLCDHNFADWPLGEREVVEYLNQWVTSHRKLTLIARTFAEVQRRHPRWVTWRRSWSHVVICYSPVEPGNFDIPTLLLVPGALGVTLLDPSHYRGYMSRDTATEVHQKSVIDVILQRSEAAFPVTTAGL
jgi:hypothetical protein